MRIKSLLLSLSLIVSLGCQSIAPTPILIGRLTDLNDEVVQLYVDCSEGANYVPTKEGCNPELLSNNVDELMTLSLNFISADIKQPQGYDIYLVTAMIYFRIGQRNLNEYSRAEQIARQFFEIQKAHSGHSLDISRFYWVHFTAATATAEYYQDKFALTESRKADLLSTLGEGTRLLDERPDSLPTTWLPDLQRSLESLRFIIAFIDALSLQ